MSLDGLRAWIGEVERKLGMRTRVFLVLTVLAIAGAGAAIYLAVDAHNKTVSESDLQSLQRQLEGEMGSGGGSTTAVTQLEAEVKELREKVEGLTGEEAGSAGEKGASEGGTSGGADSGGSAGSGSGAGSETGTGSGSAGAGGKEAGTGSPEGTSPSPTTGTGGGAAAAKLKELIEQAKGRWPAARSLMAGSPLLKSRLYQERRFLLPTGGRLWQNARNARGASPGSVTFARNPSRARA